MHLGESVKLGTKGLSVDSLTRVQVQGLNTLHVPVGIVITTFCLKRDWLIAKLGQDHDCRSVSLLQDQRD